MQQNFVKLLAAFVVSPLIAFSQTQSSSYAGQEQRAIKALSPQDIKMYLEGHGMGFAKAAELNHYPGPRHVLDLATELKLSHEQFTKTQKILTPTQTAKYDELRGYGKSSAPNGEH